MFGIAGGRKTYAARPIPRYGSRDIALSHGRQYVHGDVSSTPCRKKGRKVSFTQPAKMDHWRFWSVWSFRASPEKVESQIAYGFGEEYSRSTSHEVTLYCDLVGNLLTLSAALFFLQITDSFHAWFTSSLLEVASTSLTPLPTFLSRLKLNSHTHFLPYPSPFLPSFLPFIYNFFLSPGT